jgi:hypothetical protein
MLPFNAAFAARLKINWLSSKSSTVSDKRLLAGSYKLKWEGLINLDNSSILFTLSILS